MCDKTDILKSILAYRLAYRLKYANFSPMKPELLTPLHLQILIHAYCYPTRWPRSGGVNETCQQELLDAGLIQKTNQPDEFYNECTDRGKAHVYQLMNLSLPMQAWVNKDGKVLPI